MKSYHSVTHAIIRAHHTQQRTVHIDDPLPHEERSVPPRGKGG